uniref:Uncharacterized protein n=1 Tax=Panagrolaimus sp. JU765 TaxID=591449 RepID=A0AC34RLC0_9BILA
MPRIKTVTRTTAAQELINENVPLESRSPSRTPTQSPARRKEAASPRTRSALSRHVVPVDQMDFQSEEMQHSPPKQRKIDDSEVKSKKGRNLQLQLAPPVVEDVHMEENHFSPSSAGIQQDLSDRITKMIVSQLGIRKR